MSSWAPGGSENGPYRVARISPTVVGLAFTAGLPKACAQSESARCCAEGWLQLMHAVPASTTATRVVKRTRERAIETTIPGCHRVRCIGTYRGVGLIESAASDTAVAHVQLRRSNPVGESFNELVRVREQVLLDNLVVVLQFMNQDGQLSPERVDDQMFSM
jgi:hypothetical protein